VERSNAIAWACWGGCAAIWGTTWLAIKIGYAAFPPFWAASLRFFIAAGVLVVLAAAFERQARITWATVRTMLWVGIAFIVGDYAFVYWGEQFLASGMTAVLFGTSPFFVAGFAFLMLGERWTSGQVACAAVAFAGVVVISWADLRQDPSGFLPVAAILVAAAGAALGSVVMRRDARLVPPFTLNAGSMLIGASVLLLVSAVAGERPVAPHGLAGWGSLLYLSLFGSVVAFVLFAQLLKRWPAGRAGTLVFLTPMIALAAGALARGEAPDGRSWAGIALILGGTAAFFASGARRAPPAPADIAPAQA
jgi:drug/metabolite transporter (DMT)-like permease